MAREFNKVVFDYKEIISNEILYLYADLKCYSNMWN